MGRLIDTSNIRVKPQYMQDVMGIAMIRCEDLSRILADAPTVEAIPKAEVKKFLEEGTKDVANNVLAIVREDYIHKSEYETRLKADMVAMLTEIQLEIEELDSRAGYSGDGMPTFANDYVRIKKINEIIQQKINALRGEANDSKNSIGYNPCGNC